MGPLLIAVPVFIGIGSALIVGAWFIWCRTHPKILNPDELFDEEND